MLTQKRRDVEVFSLSFMDCICCGFGAVLLIFILTTGQKSNYDESDVKQLEERIARLERELELEKKEFERLAKTVSLSDLDLKTLREQNAQTQLRVTEREKELQLLLAQLSSLKDAMAKLLDDKKELPTQAEAPPLPIPNEERRQYLTGFELEGDYVLFLVRISGSMLDETIDTAAARLIEPDFKKREAPKWQRVLRSLEWMIASLHPETHFQVMLFNDDPHPLLPNRPDEWIDPRDPKAVGEAVTRLREIVPGGSANLERAFGAIREMARMPDRIVLFTDGLPTQSDSVPVDGAVDDDTRVRLFRVATRRLPPAIPVCTILFPMTGDPASPALYWELANSTRGACLSPSKNWPDT